jgi:hypothetical protein
MIPTSARLWELRILFLGSLGVLPSALAGSPFPASWIFAFDKVPRHEGQRAAAESGR